MEVELQFHFSMALKNGWHYGTRILFLLERKEPFLRHWLQNETGHTAGT